MKRKKTSHAERSTPTPKSADAPNEPVVNGKAERKHPQPGPAFQESNILSKHLETAIIGTALKPETAECNVTDQPTENVPIFALHPKGTYYIPMSIELSLIGSLFNPPSADPANEEAILHPVTISVNFCHPVRLLTQRPTDLAPPAIPQQQYLQQQQQQQQQHQQQHYLQQQQAKILHERWLTSSERQPHPYELDVESRLMYEGRCEENRIRMASDVRMSRYDEPKMFRKPRQQEQLNESAVDNSRRRNEHGEHRSGGSRASRTDEYATTINSSRWSHLMANNKRTHTP